MYSEQTLKHVSSVGCITATISSAIFTASLKYFLFLKFGGWNEDVGILRSMSIGFGGLIAPTTTPSNRSPQPTASIRISFEAIKQPSVKLIHNTILWRFSLFSLLMQTRIYATLVDRGGFEPPASAVRERRSYRTDLPAHKCFFTERNFVEDLDVSVKEIE